MADYQQRTKKRFGQHFLNDPGIIARIIAAFAPKPDEQIVEIGPGAGALTIPLLQILPALHVVEIDRDVINWLSKSVHAPKLTILAIDALKLDINEFNIKPIRIIGNLPYNISTPLIFNLLEQAEHVQDMLFMLQKEVVDRLTASPGSKHWGRLAIMAQYRCETEHLFDVPATAFTPPPKVESAMIALKPKTLSEQEKNTIPALAKIVNLAFQQRRKTLRNTLKGIITPDTMVSLNIDPSCRAETLDLDQFIALSHHISA